MQYDCSFCVTAAPTMCPAPPLPRGNWPRLTIGFYRRNYIEGLFLSSAVLGSPDATMERMIEALRILREEYRFRGYIHAKASPGADPLLVRRLGFLADGFRSY